MRLYQSQRKELVDHEFENRFTHAEICGDVSLSENKELIEEYEIEPPYSSVIIVREKGTDVYSYLTVEPALKEDTRVFLINARGNFVSSIDYFPASKKERTGMIRKFLWEFNDESHSNLSELELERVFYYFHREFEGYGLIQVPLLDDYIEDISCVGPKSPIHLFHRKFGSIASNIIFEREDELDNYVRLIVQRAGKHISISVPMVDCSLPTGARLQATLGREITKNGSTFTIRRFRDDPLTPIDLIKLGTMNTNIAAYMWQAIEMGQNIFIVGGTASGKTTTLNALLSFIPPDKKIVSIEDTRELNIPHENWVQNLTRQGTGDVNPLTGKKVGEVDMFDLLVNSLRQRPDYIIVGEVRGREAYTVFQSMAIGHTAVSTFHANDIPSFIHRLEGEPLNIPRSLISSLNIIVLQAIVKKGERSVRRIQRIVEVVGIEKQTNEVVTNTVFEWDPDSDKFLFSGHSNMNEEILRSGSMSLEQLDLITETRKKVLEEIGKKERMGIYDFTDLVNRPKNEWSRYLDMYPDEKGGN
ncbi:MAG: type II/IV secretion system ATPase subunit [Thermoplasmatales archaeon]